MSNQLIKHNNENNFHSISEYITCDGENCTKKIVRRNLSKDGKIITNIETHSVPLSEINAEVKEQLKLTDIDIFNPFEKLFSPLLLEDNSNQLCNCKCANCLLNKKKVSSSLSSSFSKFKF